MILTQTILKLMIKIKMEIQEDNRLSKAHAHWYNTGTEEVTYRSFILSVRSNSLVSPLRQKYDKNKKRESNNHKYSLYYIDHRKHSHTW